MGYFLIAEGGQWILAVGGFGMARADGQGIDYRQAALFDALQ